MSGGEAARAALRALRGYELPAVGVGLSSLALALLEGAGLWVILPQLESLNAGGRAGRRRPPARDPVDRRGARGSACGRGVYARDPRRALAGRRFGRAPVTLSWRLTAVAAGVGLAGFALARALETGIRRHAVHLATAEDESTRLLVDDVEGMHVIQAFAAGPARLERHRAANRALFREAMRVHRWSAAVAPATAALYALMLVAALSVALAWAGGRVLGDLPLLVAVAVVLFRAHGQMVGTADA